jgi:hypothetical protein
VNLPYAIARLRANGRAFESLLDDVSPEQARWRPAPGQWSLLEVVCHLGDEEREDFRVRLDLTLRTPEVDWPPIDPEGWVTSRGYSKKDFAAERRSFLDARRSSIEWLHTLESPDWTRTHRHRAGWTIDAGSLLAAWLDHDLIHLRQILKLHHGWLVATSSPHVTTYAGGTW